MIYFVRCPQADAIKIGITSDFAQVVHKRLSMLQSACPLRLELIGVLRGYAAEERQLHARFASALIHGEWFRFTDEIAAFCADLLPVPVKPAPLRHANRTYRKWGSEICGEVSA